MAREKKVVDASVVTKWFVNEAGTDRALALREDHISGKVLLVAPELLFIEVLNALRYKDQKEKELEIVNRTLWEFQFHLERTNAYLLRQATRLALEHNVTLYDALYAALAHVHGCPLITADRKLSKIPQAVTL